VRGTRLSRFRGHRCLGGDDDAKEVVWFLLVAMLLSGWRKANGTRRTPTMPTPTPTPTPQKGCRIDLPASLYALTAHTHALLLTQILAGVFNCSRV